MKPGETFLGFDLANHLWIVLSEHGADGRVAVVNLTTHGRSALCARGSCVNVIPGEHPFVRRESCVYYRGAVMTSGLILDRTKEQGRLDQRDPLSAEILARIQRGALESELVPIEVQDAIQLTMSGDPDR